MKRSRKRNVKSTMIGLAVAGVLATSGAAMAQQGGVSGSAGVPGSGQGSSAGGSSEPSSAAADRRSYRGALPQTDAVMNPMRPQGAPSAGGMVSGAAPAVRTQSGAVNPAGLPQSAFGAAQRGAAATSLPTRPSREAIERSDEVRQLQQQLLLRGYSPGPIDGTLGGQTRAALRDFQKTEGMPITGELTQQTRMMLGVGPTNPGSRPFSRSDAPQPAQPVGATAPTR
jgi:hypothetical protein